MTEQDYASALAEFIEEARFGSDRDGLSFGPTDAELIAKALRMLAAPAAEVAPHPAQATA